MQRNPYRTPSGWPYLKPDNLISSVTDYSRELANKLENSDAAVAEAINAATQAQDAASRADSTAAGVDNRIDARLAGLPHATAAGQVSLTAADGSQSAEGIVTFPAGRFTVPPIVVVSHARFMPWTYKMIPRPTEITTTGCKVQTWMADGTTLTGNRTVVLAWMAVQMTSTTAEG